MNIPQQKRGKWRGNCEFTDRVADNAYTEFTSVKYNKSLIAFSRRGRPRAVISTEKGGVKAVQFIERASNIRLYRAGRKLRKRGGKGIDLYRRKKQVEKIYVSMKKWREFKRWLKFNTQTASAKVNTTTTAVPPLQPTAVQLSSRPTSSIRYFRDKGRT